MYNNFQQNIIVKKQISTKMDNTDAKGSARSVVNQILLGMLKGTSATHLLPLPEFGIINLFEPNLFGPKTPILEKLVTRGTAIAEAVGYYALARRGIPAYYLPIATNAIATIGGIVVSVLLVSSGLSLPTLVG